MLVESFVWCRYLSVPKGSNLFDHFLVFNFLKILLLWDRVPLEVDVAINSLGLLWINGCGGAVVPWYYWSVIAWVLNVFPVLGSEGLAQHVFDQLGIVAVSHIVVEINQPKILKQVVNVETLLWLALANFLILPMHLTVVSYSGQRVLLMVLFALVLCLVGLWHYWIWEFYRVLFLGVNEVERSVALALTLKVVDVLVCEELCHGLIVHLRKNHLLVFHLVNFKLLFSCRFEK